MTVSSIRMNAAQYFQLGEDPAGIRLELVNGEIAVSPSPTPEHSRIVTQLSILLGNFVNENDFGELLTDVDTVFGEYDVRRPDLLFFEKARRSLLTAKRLTGKPDLAIEVVSESSITIDKSDKFKQYAKGGVKHYWIIDPEEKTFKAYTLKSGKYALTTKGSNEDTVHAHPFDDLPIPLKKLWWRK
jgi:Uma2 family endonuclease